MKSKSWMLVVFLALAGCGGAEEPLDEPAAKTGPAQITAPACKPPTCNVVGAELVCC